MSSQNFINYKEFENVDDDDEEIMCPHCGSIGDSPL